MTQETKTEILDILDNVLYWETCPDDYKIRIQRVKQALKTEKGCNKCHKDNRFNK